MTSREAVLFEVDAERENQNGQWGGADHDDKHSLADWNRFIDHQQHEATYEDTLPQVRKRFIKMAALAVAAVESIDRATQPD